MIQNAHGIKSNDTQFVVAFVAIAAVIIALRTSNRQIEENRNQQTKQIEASDKQLNKQIEESRRLATEERQQQSCPIIVPTKPIPNVSTKQVQGIPDQYL